MTERKNGLTLLEVVVVIALIGLLTAILLPAIHHARTAAVRADCRNRLRQLGLALSGYCTDYGRFPPRGFSSHGTGPWVGQLALLPYLEQKGLYDALNLDLFWEAPGNTTVGGISPGVFMCPADGVPDTRGYGVGNYAGCTGSGLWPRGLDAEVSGSSPYDGIFFGRKGVTPADCTDGLAHTAAFSERVHGAAYRGITLIQFSQLPIPTPGMEYTLARLSPRTQRNLIESCDKLGPVHSSLGFAAAGTPWFQSGPLSYNHLITPNRPVCIGERYGDVFSPRPPSSRHSGVVHVAFGDGHVAAVTDSVDLTIWRAIGSRDGGESVDSPF